MDKMVTYHVWTDGDPSVGISGSSAQVTMFPPEDEEKDKFIRFQLKVCFENIWDFRVQVMTEEEMKEDEDASG